MTNNRKPVKVLPAACVSGTAISSMGMAAPPPVESTATPAPQPSQRIYLERVPVRGNTLPEFNSVSAAVKGNDEELESLSTAVLVLLFCVFLLFIILRDDLQASVFTALLICFGSTGFYSSKGFGWEVKRSNCDMDLEWKTSKKIYISEWGLNMEAARRRCGAVTFLKRLKAESEEQPVKTNSPTPQC